MKLTEYLAEKPKTQLIFDFDETLFWLILPWDLCHETIKDELIKIDKKLWNDMWAEKISFSEMENGYVRKYGNEVKTMIIKSRLLFEKKYLKEVKLNHDLIGFILENQNYSYYLWSSNTAPVIRHVLEHYGMESLFKMMVTRSDVDMLKPEAEGFTKIYTPNYSKKEYLLIGDSSADEMAAKRAGIDFLKVNYFRQ